MKTIIIKKLHGMFKYYLMGAALLLIISCGSDTGSSENSASDTGSVAFSIVMSDSSSGKSGGLMNAVIDCSAEGIDTIFAGIYDQSGTLLKMGGPWACNAHTGNIMGIQPGSNYQCIITGNTADQYIKGWGQTAGFSVIAGQTTDTGEITMTTCSAGSIYDCNFNCEDETWLDDNYCDDVFDCDYYDYDNADCLSPAGVWFFDVDLDCEGSVYVPTYTVTLTLSNDGTFTDSFGDSGTWTITGDFIEFTYSYGDIFSGTVVITQNYMEGTLTDGSCWYANR